MKEEMVIRLVQLAEVFIVRLQRDGLGIRTPAADPANQHVGRRLKVDHQIGRSDVVREQFVQPLVDEQLVIVEVEEGKDLVLVEQIVRDRDLAEKIRLTERNLLAVSVQQVEQLCLEGRARAVGVEIGQERVVGFFEDDGGVETCAESFGQRSFSRSNRTLDRDVPELQCEADDIIGSAFSRAT